MDMKQNVQKTMTYTYKQIHFNVNIMYVNKVPFMTAMQSLQNGKLHHGK